MLFASAITMEVSKMSTTLERPDVVEMREEFAAFGRNWVWFVVLEQR